MARKRLPLFVRLFPWNRRFWAIPSLFHRLLHVVSVLSATFAPINVSHAKARRYGATCTCSFTCSALFAHIYTALKIVFADRMARVMLCLLVLAMGGEQSRMLAGPRCVAPRLQLPKITSQNCANVLCSQIMN